MLVRPANFLLLDEPTNHLDIPSRDVLEDALTEYTGTICFITHDRHFIQSVADTVLEVSGGTATTYPDGYEYYVEKKARQAAESATRNDTPAPRRRLRRARPSPIGPGSNQGAATTRSGGAGQAIRPDQAAQDAPRCGRTGIGCEGPGAGATDDAARGTRALPDSRGSSRRWATTRGCRRR
jgi:ATPase subunit of ABC transporter with duplicated ATPase domains